MMKKHIILLILSFLFLLLLAVSAQAEKTVIMIYMTGSDLESLGGAASKDLSEMMSAANEKADYQIVVMASGSTDWEMDIDPSETSIFEILPGMLKKVYTSPVRNMGESETLSYFLQWTYANYPANQYALILWDHGGGPLLGICFDEHYPINNGLDSLSINEMRHALENSPFQKQQLLFIGFDACLMSTFEVASAVCPFAEYMVASQEIEPADGWDYSFLSDISGMETGDSWGKKIVDSYQRYYQEQTKTVTLACLDLAKFQYAAQIANDLFISLLPNLSQDTYAVYTKCRVDAKILGSSAISSYDLIDMVDLFDLYQEASLCNASELKKALEEATIANVALNTEYVHGLSIYFPFDNKKSYIDSWSETYFNLEQNEGYQSFIRAFSDIYIGQALFNWRRNYETIMRREHDTISISIDLTADEVWNVARARMIVMEMIDPDAYQFVYYSTHLQQFDSRLSANYNGEALYLLDSSRNKSQGPISYLPDGDGFTIYALIYFDIDWDKPLSEQKFMTDAILKFVPAEDGTYVLSEILTSDASPDGQYMPSSIQLDTCMDIEILNFGPVDNPTGVRSLDFKLFYPGICISNPSSEMSFSFFPSETTNDRFAYIRLTDLQGETICSDVIPLTEDNYEKDD